MAYPALDPIPLPAPVWLFKALHMLLLSLHFTAVHLFIGALAVGTLWNALGHRRGADPLLRRGADALAGYLPALMTFVINLGIPPLLFAQVLYGVALYTSSILLGAYWISVIGLLMLLYGLLYAMSRRAAAARPWAGLGLAALLLAAAIAKIYVTNMTLMLRPEVWVELYRVNAHGTVLPLGDSTVLPRWTFMMLGALTLSGVGVALLGRRRIYPAELRAFFVRRGGLLLGLHAPLWLLAGYWVLRSQPAAVAERLAAQPVFVGLAWGWVGLGLGLSVLGWSLRGRGAAGGPALAVATGALAVLTEAAAVIARDILRDTTLALKGFAVAQRTLHVNLPVLGIFAGVLVLGVGLLAWLLVRLARARPVMEGDPV